MVDYESRRSPQPVVSHKIVVEQTSKRLKKQKLQAIGLMLCAIPFVAIGKGLEEYWAGTILIWLGFLIAIAGAGWLAITNLMNWWDRG